MTERLSDLKLQAIATLPMTSKREDIQAMVAELQERPAGVSPVPDTNRRPDVVAECQKFLLESCIEMEGQTEARSTIVTIRSLAADMEDIKAGPIASTAGTQELG